MSERNGEEKGEFLRLWKAGNIIGCLTGLPDFSFIVSTLSMFFALCRMGQHSHTHTLKIFCHYRSSVLIKNSLSESHFIADKSFVLFYALQSVKISTLHNWGK